MKKDQIRSKCQEQHRGRKADKNIKRRRQVMIMMRTFRFDAYLTFREKQNTPSERAGGMFIMKKSDKIIYNKKIKY
jgi:hypothetical protein